MNDFKKIVPKKPEKKRATSVKRNNSLKEENKKSFNTERFYTTYEVFEKLNTNRNKKVKIRANSSSKKKKKSKNKNFSSLERKKKLNFIDNNITNNTQYSTYETEYNKKNKKISPRKKEFSNILTKAKELLSIQSDILIQCGKLNKSLTKNEMEIETKLKNETNSNGTNVLPGLAKALYLLELKKENNTIKESNNNKNIIKDNDNKSIEKYNEKIDNSFYIKKFNELNGFIGELGYSYVYNEFFNENYKKENLIIYFDNIQKLINMLHQTLINQNEILIKQENQIKEYENIINEYKIYNTTNKFQDNYITYNNKENSKPDMNSINSIPKNQSSIEINNYNNINNNKSNSKNHILIKENLYYNNIDEIKENLKHNVNNNIDINYNTNNLYQNNSKEFYKTKDINNVFKDNSVNINEIKKESPKNTHYYNSYIEQISLQGQNKDNLINDNSINQSKDINCINYNEKEEQNNKQNITSDMGTNYLNYLNETNILSNMIDSGSFFESYKRNKELKHNLNFNYNENKLNNE